MFLCNGFRVGAMAVFGFVYSSVLDDEYAISVTLKLRRNSIICPEWCSVSVCVLFLQRTAVKLDCNVAELVDI